MKKKLEFLLTFSIGILLFSLSFAFDGAMAIVSRCVGLVLALFSATLLLRSEEKSKEPVVNLNYEYQVKQSIMSPAEQRLYSLLKCVVGREFEIYPQMALISLVDKKTASSYRNELFRVVDFALVDVRNFKPVLVIELNDASHKRKDRMERDEKVKCILSRAGLNLLTLWVDDFEEMDLRREIYSALRRR